MTMPQKEHLPAFTSNAFDFFYWFSRIEFALKMDRRFRYARNDGAVQPGWNSFIREFEGVYEQTEAARALLDARPRQQVIDETGEIVWIAVDVGNLSSLGASIRLLRTIRNNLFHGGKHSPGGWDNSERNQHLIQIGKTVLDEIADLGELQHTYREA